MYYFPGCINLFCFCFICLLVSSLSLNKLIWASTQKLKRVYPLGVWEASRQDATHQLNLLKLFQNNLLLHSESKSCLLWCLAQPLKCCPNFWKMRSSKIFIIADQMVPNSRFHWLTYHPSQVMPPFSVGKYSIIRNKSLISVLNYGRAHQINSPKIPKTKLLDLSS